MKLWLDDERDPKAKHIQEQFGADGDEIWVKTPNEAIELLKTNQVTSISLDHDLGYGVETGDKVAKYIEENAFNGTLSQLKCKIHSMNPVGRVNMGNALRNAHKYWANKQ